MSSESSLALSETAYAELLVSLEEEARSEAGRRGLNWPALMADVEEHSPARQALTILRLGLFDARWYLATYPDIAAADFEPLTHYINLGDAEGRRPNAYFDPMFYRAQFGDTALRSVTALYHYAVMGEALGLSASGAFSARRYLASNATLQPWLDRPLTHFLRLGRPGGLMANLRARVADEQKVRFARSTLPPPVARRGENAAINLIGPLDRVSGLGVSARGYLDGLRRADVLPIGCRAQRKEFAIQKAIRGSGDFPDYLPDAPINLVHMNGDTLPVMIQEAGDGFLRGRYNIAVWYWELPTLRPEWQASMKYFHEFWAPTPFIARALRQSTAKPVHLIPPYLSYLGGLSKSDGAPDRTPQFVYCFDANSILERKNPGALLDAFRQAFPAGGRDVRLTFKVTYPNRTVPEVERLYAAAAEDSRIEVIDRLVSDADLHALIASATAYVSPHRSEGLGLTVIEAMGAGVPVISTGFGGVDAFVTDETAFPIAHRPIELAADYFPYPRGYVWAEPDVESLARQLRRVLAEPQEAKRRAQSARQRVLDYFCSESLVDTYRSRLQALAIGQG